MELHEPILKSEMESQDHSDTSEMETKNPDISITYNISTYPDLKWKVVEKANQLPVVRDVSFKVSTGYNKQINLMFPFQ